MRKILVVTILVGCTAQSGLGYLQPPSGTRQEIGLSSIDGRLAGALEAEYRKQADRVQPPVSLVPTDGTELALKTLAANIDIDGPVAHTELRFAFHNAEQRTREGRFAITLPPNAAITRFAMKIAGEWREARIVSRDKGRQVYEHFLHRKVDPALLEQDLGNVFSARVFPIAALEDKEIIVAYDHPVSSARGYALALNGLPKIGRLAVAIDNDGELRTFAKTDSVPEDIVLPVARGTAAARSGEAFVARIEGGATNAGDAPLDRVLYLVDTSASRAPVMGKQAQLLRELLRAHPPQSMVAIATYDQTTAEVSRGPASRMEDFSLSWLAGHGALGGSNLGAALERATTAGMSRVVIIGDGTPTVGEHDAEKLAAIVGSRIERIDAIQVGQTIDRTTLERLVRAGRKPGAVLDGSDPAMVALQLSTAVADPVAITVEGTTEVWPATTRDVAPGEPVFVYGLRKGDGPIVVRVGDKAFDVTPRNGHARLRRAVARAELAALVESTAEDKWAAVEKLALAHELVSPRTSLIVLETEADERAFLDTPGVPRDFTRNIPTGRTFESVVGRASGSQSDALGVSFSGLTSLENQYFVDGVNTTGLTFGTVNQALTITGRYIDPYLMAGTKNVRADVMSPLALDVAAEAIRRNAFAFTPDRSEYTPPAPSYAKPYTGAFEDVMRSIAKRDGRALELATTWHVKNPGDVAAILALGEALEASGAGLLAARAYGSIADLYPNRAELLRVAGERLDRVGARELAIDVYRRAIRERPDHASTYRLLAWTLFRANRPEEALEVIGEGIKHTQRASVQQILLDDAGIIAANIVARHPERRYAMPLPIATKPTLRFTLTWETDANDVDLHVKDGKGGHAYYKGSRLSSGGGLIDDMTDGYGPEMFVVEDPRAFPYKLSAHYYNKGAMGLGLGTVQVIRHDGAGGVVIEDRPFVIQNDNAMVELGTVAVR